MNCIAYDIHKCYREDKLYINNIYKCYKEEKLYSYYIHKCYSKDKLYSYYIHKCYSEDKLYTIDMRNRDEETNCFVIRNGRLTVARWRMGYVIF